MFTLLYFTFIYFTLLFVALRISKLCVHRDKHMIVICLMHAHVLCWVDLLPVTSSLQQSKMQASTGMICLKIWHLSGTKRSLGEVRHHVVKSLFFGRIVFLAKVESTTVCTWHSPGPGHKGFPARWSINFAFVAYPEVRGMLIRNQTVQFRNSSASVWILQALGFNDSQLGANN